MKICTPFSNCKNVGSYSLLTALSSGDIAQQNLKIPVSEIKPVRHRISVHITRRTNNLFFYFPFLRHLTHRPFFEKIISLIL